MSDGYFCHRFDSGNAAGGVCTDYLQFVAVADAGRVGVDEYGIAGCAVVVAHFVLNEKSVGGQCRYDAGCAYVHGRDAALHCLDRWDFAALRKVVYAVSGLGVTVCQHAQHSHQYE